MGDMIVFTTQDNLKKEIEKLRVEISMAILEHDDLLYVQCKNIESAYFLTFGSLESQVYQAEIHWRRLRRKLELFIKARNHQTAPDLKKIEEQLDREFLDYQIRLDSLYDKINEALEYSGLDVLSKEDSQKLKKLYRMIVKQLHPDLNPAISEAQKKLFFRAVEAYENGLLSVLEVIAETLGTGDQKDCGESLVEERKRLKSVLNQVQTRILEIKSDYPYLLKEFLQNEETKTAHRKTLEGQLRFYQEKAHQYEAEIASYL